MKKVIKNKRAFTLIELLAVIIILGILMIIAIPAVTTYISNSRKNAYVATAKQYVSAATIKVNSLEYSFTNPDIAYYVPSSCITLEKGGKSPFGEWTFAYVVVTFDGKSYNYYWTSKDSAGYGISLKKADDLKTEDVMPNLNSAPPVAGESIVIDGKTYITGLSSCQGSIDTNGIAGLYKESILNGTEPVISNNLIAVTIESNGTVKKANIETEWYKYESKNWANAVILLDKTKTYSNGEVIPESNIESYFVWIPRYKYKLWNVSNVATTGVNTSMVQTIEIEFESKATSPSNGTTNGSYLTHPAFTNFNTNGIWVAKFETGYKGATSTGTAQVNSSDSSKIIVKPDVYSWRSIQVANAYTASYNYQRGNESHMMMNMEWGAVAYLSHSQYGNTSSIRINNNSSYKTGYAAVSEPTQEYPEYLGYGTSTAVTQGYNTATGYLASTTGNISGIYDMSGGAHEYVMGVLLDSSGNPYSGRHNIYNSGFNGKFGCPTCDPTVAGVDSGITALTTGINFPSTKYYDTYTGSGDRSKGKLGDATKEMGPFGSVTTTGTEAQCGVTLTCTRWFGSWYKDSAYFVSTSYPWFLRGGSYNCGSEAGVFYFSSAYGVAHSDYSFRLVLAQ